MRVLFFCACLLFPNLAWTEPPIDFMSANRLACEGDLPMFATGPNGTRKVSANELASLIKKESARTLHIGIDPKSPWLSIWPWYGIHFKKLKDPKIKGAKLNFETNATDYFTVELQLTAKLIERISCRLLEMDEPSTKAKPSPPREDSQTNK